MQKWPRTFSLFVVVALALCETANRASCKEETFNHRLNDPEALKPYYALDPRKSKRLALLEEILVDTLQKTLFLEESVLKYGDSYTSSACQTNLKQYLSEYKEDRRNNVVGVKKAKQVSENPILTFKMIRRMVATLLNGPCMSRDKSTNRVPGIVDETFLAANLSPPTFQDLNDALLGFVRIQYIYGFNASQLRHGIFSGIETNVHLKFHDCLALAKKALELEGDAIAYQWLTSAEMLATGTDKQELDANWRALMEFVKVETRGELRVKLENKQQEKLKSFLKFKQYALCREGIGNVSRQRPSYLSCFYQHMWHPYFFISPVKTEVLFDSPPVFQFYDFVGNNQIEHMWLLTRKHLRRSGGSSQYKSEVEFGDFRTSMSLLYEDMWVEQPDPVLINLNRKIEKLTGLNLVKNRSSILQMVLYGGVGGHTDFHLDSLQNTLDLYSEEGDRIATFLMFISDVTLGGYTAFAKLGIYAEPIKGSAIFWLNLLQNGKPDRRSLHGGCPVILGTKEVANRWIHEYDNIWNNPCAQNPYE